MSRVAAEDRVLRRIRIGERHGTRAIVVSYGEREDVGVWISRDHRRAEEFVGAAVRDPRRVEGRLWRPLEFRQARSASRPVYWDQRNTSCPEFHSPSPRSCPPSWPPWPSHGKPQAPADARMTATRGRDNDRGEHDPFSPDAAARRNLVRRAQDELLQANVALPSFWADQSL